MKAVICAAGEGKRMRPLTEAYPKALLPVGSKTIIEHTLDAISASGITDVVIVVGYKAEAVRDKIGSRYKNCSIAYVTNGEYETTNNIYSLWLARNHITDGMIFFNGDILFHPQILKGIVADAAPDSFVADPFSTLEDDAMKVVLREGRMRKIGKHLQGDANAWAIGIYKLSQKASKEYFKEAERLFRAGQKNVSFVVPLQAIVDTFPLAKHKVLAQYGWAEIDTPEDYAKAKQRIDSIALSEIVTETLFSNFDELAVSPLRKKVLAWANNGIIAALPSRFMPEHVRFEDGILHVGGAHISVAKKRIFVVGAGKASGAMALELERILGAENITAGIVLSNDTSSRPQKIEIHEADHPVPTERSVSGSQKILDLKTKFRINEDDVIIALVSGGGSSLMAYPVDGVSLSDKQKTIEALIKSGGNVHEITIIKKKISQVKGGKLAQYFHPTQIVSLILSDVVGNDVDVISSGPFAEDRSTVLQALQIIERRGIRADIPGAVLDYLEKESKTESGRRSFDHVRHEILADNATALRKIRESAEKEGIEVVLVPDVQGEAREVAYRICGDIHGRTINKPTLFLYGGETTVTLEHPHKKGGRNQEFVAACLQYLLARPFREQWCAASVGTDGIDFIRESAGAIIDSHSVVALKEQGLHTELSSFLERHKTGRLLEQINSIIRIGRPTGTNVCDIMMFLLIPDQA